jgi:apolipoprotein N-acyltransferase
MIRAANTGISAILDPYGRTVAMAPLGIEAVVDGGLPKALPPTLFSRYPYVAPIILWIFVLVGAFIRPRRV